jgi:uncharacterized protein YciI
MEDRKKQFVYIVKPVKENFEKTATEKDNKIVGEHFLYLKNLLEEKKLILAGPQVNAKFGIVVFEADSEKEAEHILQNDPAVTKGVFTAELFPFRVSLLRN